MSYNEDQAQKYGWTPEWFGCTTFGDELTEAIKTFQKENGLTVDGYCGPSTYRRKWTDVESSGDFIPSPSIEPGDKFIVHNGEEIEIFWDKVIVWTDKEGKKAKSYTSQAGKVDRKPSCFITHWDVCLSSDSCYNVLNNRKLSVHFGLDNDGTIWQWLDTQHIAYHAGSTVNKVAIGVEVSDAYYTKYQDWYVRNGFGERPVWSDAQVHGKTLDPFLGFYDVQLRALAALWEACSFAADIPLELPATKNTVDPQVRAGKFHGFANHYHITTGKIDCAGLDNELIIEWAKELRKRR